MDLGNTEKNLQRLNRSNLYRVLLYAFYCWLRYKIGLLRPIQMLFPLTLFQILFFVIAGILEDIVISTIGSVFLACVALVPITVKKPKRKVHWITRGR